MSEAAVMLPRPCVSWTWGWGTVSWAVNAFNRSRDIRDLRRLLRRHVATSDLRQWDLRPNKSVRHLYREMVRGETVLTLDTEQRLVRNCTAIGVDIYATYVGRRLRLRELAQELPNGYVHYRSIANSLTEKGVRGEHAADTAIRGVEEELGLKLSTADRALLLCVRRYARPLHSARSYPGLYSNHQVYEFAWEMPARFINPCGYVSEEDDLSTYFVWDEVDPATGNGTSYFAFG